MLPIAETGMDSGAIKRGSLGRKLPYRDFYRALLAGCLLIIVFAAAFYDRDWLSGTKRDKSYTLNGGDDHALRTGSVLIVPPSGNRCKHRLIDNYTWLMRDNGYVTCNELGTRGNDQTGGTYHSGSRLDSIRDAFNRKK